MAAAAWLRRFRWLGDSDPRRLRALLALLFVALAIPTGAVIWQAYGQLKFEAFYQYRNQAEALAERIDAGLSEDIAREEARRFTDFAFLNVAGDPAANVLQRSPLSAYPVSSEVPGAQGYFQVSTDGEFSTPLLPDAGTAPEELGVTVREYEQRARLAREIRLILADNRLVRARPAPGSLPDVEEAPADGPGGTLPPAPDGGRARDVAPAAVPVARSSEERFSDDAAGADDEAAAGFEAVSGIVEREESYSQQVFDQLKEPSPAAGTSAELRAAAAAAVSGTGSETRANALGKLEDLELDEDLQKKSEVIKQRLDESAAESRQEPKRGVAARARRVEQATSREPAVASPRRESVWSGTESGARIDTFESEIDPYEFSLLDSGHLVLFRKVWRNGERYIQGLLIDRDRFLAEAIETAYRFTPLAGMTDLVIGYRDDVVTVIRGGAGRSYPAGSGDFQGTLLHRASLSAPFEELELVFSINRLPPGAGANVLAWTTLVIAAVFVAGFVALYRLALGQIRLARQQQDFVSAVSHELKTPLTSIRMYSEMLREGWADESKRSQYYDYIHDESERLTRLITNVLQLASITRNEPQFDLRPTSVGELMNQIESKIASQVERAGFELLFERTEHCDRATIEIDDDCFAQIVINLVDNAIKFSNGAAVKAINIGSSLSQDGRVTIRVRDHGPGIPKDQMRKIFDLFYRSESELTRETVGTGIGLAIVHQLTLAMNGTVDVINRNPGAEFRLTFPVAD